MVRVKIVDGKTGKVMEVEMRYNKERRTIDVTDVQNETITQEDLDKIRWEGEGGPIND